MPQVKVNEMGSHGTRVWHLQASQGYQYGPNSHGYESVSSFQFLACFKACCHLLTSVS